jgi:hypothetical protein
MSISHVNVLLGCVCRYQYESAIPSAAILASGPASFSHSFVLGMSITPSIIAWETCTPCGPNSFAKLDDRARNAYLPVLKDDISALALTLAVAPVKMSVGGYVGDEPLERELRRRGRKAREKRNAPRAETSRPAKNSSSVSSRNGLRTKRPLALNTAACTNKYH